MKDYLFIGDIHSQARPLEGALNYALSHRLIPVLLGDLWDSRNEVDNSARVMQLVLNYPDVLLLCNSNHQWAMLRYLLGKRGANPAINRTMLSLAPYESILERWMLSTPLGYILTDSSGVEYRVSHAYFPSHKNDKVLTFNNTNSKERSLLLYGPRNEFGRIKWWHDEESSDRTWVRVSGHYHYVFQGKKSLVLDGSCGDPDGVLYTYDTRQRSINTYT